jgi:RHS repeat-associated protein
VPGTLPDNVTGGLDNGWLGQHQRPVETAAGLQATIEMGARPYNPILGRFLGVDPVEGGTPNAYTYVDDPVNEFDLNGQWGWPKIPNPIKAIKNVAKKAVTATARFVRKHADTIAAVAGVASLLGCAVCAGIAFAASAISTADSCLSGKAVSCAVGIATLVVPGAASRVSNQYARSARSLTNFKSGLKLTTSSRQALNSGIRGLRVSSARWRGVSSVATRAGVGWDSFSALRSEFG